MPAQGPGVGHLLRRSRCSCGSTVPVAGQRGACRRSAVAGRSAHPAAAPAGPAGSASGGAGLGVHVWQATRRTGCSRCTFLVFRSGGPSRSVCTSDGRPGPRHLDGGQSRFKSSRNSLRRRSPTPPVRVIGSASTGRGRLARAGRDAGPTSQGPLGACGVRGRNVFSCLGFCRGRAGSIRGTPVCGPVARCGVSTLVVAQPATPRATGFATGAGPTRTIHGVPASRAGGRRRWCGGHRGWEWE